MPLEDAEILREARDGQVVRVAVIDAQAAADIDIRHRDAGDGELAHARVDAVAERDEIVHLQDLGPDMEMEPHEREMRKRLGEADGILELRMVDAELVLRQAGGDVRMGMGTDIRIHPDADRRLHVHFSSNLLDDKHFRRRFDMETADARLQAEADFVVPFADPGENEGAGREARGERGGNLPAADTVGPEARFRDDPEQVRVGIGLHRIMHLPGRAVPELPVHFLQRPAQQGGIIAIERRTLRPEQVDRKLTHGYQAFRRADAACLAWGWQCR